STAAMPESAYFSSLGRAWELALGAALAIGLSSLPAFSPIVRTIAGWLGVACVVVAAVLFSSSTPFPGYAALLPTLGAAVVIAAGEQEAQPWASVANGLALGPMRYV